MNHFSYIRATDEQEAIDAFAQNQNAVFLAGGTNLIDYIKEGTLQPGTVVDIRRVPLTQISEFGGGVRLSALATNSAVAYHPLIKERYPMLSEALLSGASPQLRNVATVGGNILQRTRCTYFRDTAFACNKREPGTGCPALEGYNRMHAILGTSEACIATHASDLCVALAALDAVVQIRGPSGARSIPFGDFHKLPGNSPERETALEKGELIVAVDLPALAFARRSRYLKVRDRASYEFALASAAVALDLRENKIVDARIALGGVGTKPWRASASEKALVGQTPGEDSFRTAADLALQGAQTRKYNAYKVELAKRTLFKTLTDTAKMEVVA